MHGGGEGKKEAKNGRRRGERRDCSWRGCGGKREERTKNGGKTYNHSLESRGVMEFGERENVFAGVRGREGRESEGVGLLKGRMGEREVCPGGERKGREVFVIIIS